MIQKYGGVGTAKRLLAKDEEQEGLMKLWELGFLDQSMEDLVIQEKSRTLFFNHEIADVRLRLEEMGYFKRDQ